jgi:hypothetical protein
MRIYDLLLESYALANNQFLQNAPADLVQNTITTYKSLVDRNQVQGQERNIDYWRKQGWELFVKFVTDKMNTPTKTQIKKASVKGKSILLQETPEWLIVMPLSHTSSCFYGKDTEWCTARPTDHYFNAYFFTHNVDLIYCINKKSGGKWAIASHKDVKEVEMFDQKDNPISESQFYTQTGMHVNAILGLIPADHHEIKQVKELRQQLVNKTKLLLNQWRKTGKARNPEIEHLLIELKSSELCYTYVMGVGKTHGAQSFPEELSKAAVAHHSYSIPKTAAASALRYIANPNNSIYRLAIRSIPAAIRLIKNPDLTIQTLAVEQDPTTIVYLKSPPYEVQAKAIKHSPWLIRAIKNPSLDLQLLAVSQDPHTITYIKNPHPSVIQAAQSKK